MIQLSVIQVPGMLLIELQTHSRLMSGLDSANW